MCATACRAPVDFTLEPLPDHDALFARQEGWTGADGAASVALPEGRVLWLFDDSWIGSIRAGKHENSSLVSNTVAIQSGKASSPQIEFYHGVRNGKPSALFFPVDGKGVFWPSSGIVTKTGLYLFMSRMLSKPGDESVFGFKPDGVTLAHVRNFDEHPRRWSISQRKVPWGGYAGDGQGLAFGSSLLREDGMIYIYGLKSGKGKRFLVLARVAEERLADFTAWRFYLSGRWERDFLKLETLADHMGAELSVSYLPGLEKYAAVYSEDGLSRNIMVRFSPRPEGPWSPPRVVYRCPEMDWDEDYFCYAAKAHPELARQGNELIVSYVCNAFDFGKMAADARIYRPRFVKIKFR